MGARARRSPGAAALVFSAADGRAGPIAELAVGGRRGCAIAAPCTAGALGLLVGSILAGEAVTAGAALALVPLLGRIAPALVEAQE